MKNRVENVSLTLCLGVAVFVFVQVIIYIVNFIVDFYEIPTVSILM